MAEIIPSFNFGTFASGLRVLDVLASKHESQELESSCH